MTRGRDTALVTGASAGIGRGIALELARRGHDLVVVARREEELRSLAVECEREHAARVEVLPMDLLAPNAAGKLVQQLEDQRLRVDLLVNNAGLMDMGRFAQIDVERHERLLQLNVVVLTSLTRRLLGPMIERRHGRVLNVASTSAFQPVPSLALYAATKAFVLSLSESLSEELRGTGLTVTALCPGITKTDMVDRAQGEHEAMQALPSMFQSDVDDVAREGVEACLAGRPVVVPGLSNRLMAASVGFYPRWLVRGVGGLIGRSVTR